MHPTKGSEGRWRGDGKINYPNCFIDHSLNKSSFETCRNEYHGAGCKAW